MLKDNNESIKILNEIFPYEKRLFNINNSELSFQRLNYGFIVKVGCQSAAVTNKEQLNTILSLWTKESSVFTDIWYRNPNESEEEMKKAEYERGRESVEMVSNYSAIGNGTLQSN